MKGHQIPRASQLERASGIVGEPVEMGTRVCGRAGYRGQQSIGAKGGRYEKTG